MNLNKLRTLQRHSRNTDLISFPPLASPRVVYKYHLHSTGEKDDSGRKPLSVKSHGLKAASIPDRIDLINKAVEVRKLRHCAK